jgi:hypothetical protein
MVTRRVEEISATLVRLATADVSPKQLFGRARREHPNAGRKEIVRAAFFALIAAAEVDGDMARRLQNFAIAERPVSDTEE